MRLTPTHSCRRGTTTLLFALLAFALFALGALVIDLGFVRVTQRQMQTAAEAAALEGLRFRDELPPGSDPDTPADEARRQAAAGLAAQDAGPSFDVTPGGGNTDASSLVRQGTPTAFRLQPQANLNNEIHGDLVAGTFTAGQSPAEQSDYTRVDFAPAAQDKAATAPALLVRLRRTRDLKGAPRNPLDEQPGVSSAGNALPLLFARGALVKGGDPAQGYSPRHHGLSVRATAIASAVPAKTVGHPFGEGETAIAGVTPFVLTRAFWEDPGLVTGRPVQLELDEAGSLSVPATSTAPAPGLVGRYPADRVTSLGVQPGAASPPTALAAIEVGYVPIYHPLPGADPDTTTDRVIGFGRVRATPAAATPPTTLTLEVLPGAVGARNASAVLGAGFPALTAAELQALLQAHGTFAREALLAPALVR